MIFNAKEHKKKVVVVNLISDKIDFTTKGYIMIKGSIQEEDITLINLHAPGLPWWCSG